MLTPGIYLVHKTAGQTSFSVVQGFMEEVRLSGLRRDKLPVCHGGALDPFAEGLLLLLAGQATRLMDLLHPVPKTYLAEIAWGMETDNGDFLGQMTKLRRTAIGPWRDPENGRPQVRGAALYPWCSSLEITGGELETLRAGKGIGLRPPRAPDWKFPEGFPDPAAPIRALLDGALVAL